MMMRLALALLFALGLASSSLAQVPVSGTTAPGVLVVAAATGTTAGATATLAAAVGKVTYICGFSVAPGSAATAITINVTVTGPASTFTYSVGAPVTAVGTTGAILTQTFNPCISASAPNTGIAVAAGALGTAGVNQDVNAWGFQR
jgi:hypothetical protein